MNLAECISLSCTIEADDERVKFLDKDDFRCPVCRAPVFHRDNSKSDGRKKHNEFVHFHGNDTPYCELRTKSIDGLRLYNDNVQKSPFNLYLTSDGPNYHLFVQFREIPEKFSTLGENYFSISQMDLKFKISEFLEGSAKRNLPYPPTSSNCTLSYERNLDMMNLVNSWGAYIDYFYKNGAFFDTGSGMKVPVGGRLYCDTDYLFICTDKSITHNPEIRGIFDSLYLNEEGTLQSRNGIYSVMRIRFPEGIEERASNFAKYYNHVLSEKSAEPCLMWPPALRRNDIYCTLFEDTRMFIRTNKATKRMVWCIGKEIGRSSMIHSMWGDTTLVVDLDDDCTLKMVQGTSTDTISISVGTALDYYKASTLPICEFLDSNGNPVDNPKNVSMIHTNFISKSIITLMNGHYKSIFSRDGHMSLIELPKSVEIYDYRGSLVRSLTSKITSKTNKEFPKGELRSHHRIKTPAWIDAAIRNYSAVEPINARLSKISCVGGSISTELLTFLEQWR